MFNQVINTGTITSDPTVSGSLGMKVNEGLNVFRLVKAGTTIASTPVILQLDSVSSNGTLGYVVEPAHASTVPVYGFNKTGASVSTNEYFWALVEGPVVVDSTVLDSDSDIGANALLYLNSDKRIASKITATTGQIREVFGQSLASITSVASTQGTPTIMVKCFGA